MSDSLETRGQVQNPSLRRFVKGMVATTVGVIGAEALSRVEVVTDPFTPSQPSTSQEAPKPQAPALHFNRTASGLLVPGTAEAQVAAYESVQPIEIDGDWYPHMSGLGVDTFYQPGGVAEQMDRAYWNVYNRTLGMQKEAQDWSGVARTTSDGFCHARRYWAILNALTPSETIQMFGITVTRKLRIGLGAALVSDAVAYTPGYDVTDPAGKAALLNQFKVDGLPIVVEDDMGEGGEWYRVLRAMTADGTQAQVDDFFNGRNRWVWRNVGNFRKVMQPMWRHEAAALAPNDPKLYDFLAKGENKQFRCLQRADAQKLLWHLIFGKTEEEFYQAA